MKKEKELQASAERKASTDPLIQVLIVISVIISTVAIYFIMTSSGPKPGPKETQLHEQYSASWAKIGENFTLIDTEGAAFSSGKLRGKPNLVYFGFTYCPDICPAELQKISTVVDLLKVDNIDIFPVFITIDPDRDTPAVLKTYLKNFNHDFVGLTGTDEQIKKVTEMFKVYYEKADTGNSVNSNYMMNHTAYIYLLDKFGKFVKIFDNSVKAEDITQAIKEHVAI